MSFVRLRRPAMLLAVALLSTVTTGLVASTPQASATGSTSFAGVVDNDSGTTDPKTMVHTLQVDTAGIVDVTLGWATPAANLTLILKKPDGTQAAVAATSNRPEHLTYDATLTGAYKLNVIAVSGGSDYTVDATTGGTPPADGTFSFAGTVDNDAGTPAPKTVTHAFAVTKTGSIVATLDWADPSANLTLVLKNPNGTQAAIAATSSKPERIVYNATVTGTYKLNVIAATGGSTYTVEGTSGGAVADGSPRYQKTIGGWAHPQIAPSGLDVDRSGNVYAASTANDEIKKYSPAGAVLWTVGTRGSMGNGSFSNPRDVAFGNGKVYVADTGFNRVQVLDAETGDWLSTWSTHFAAAMGISVGVDANGALIVLVSDATANAVKIFTPAGVLIRTLGGTLGSADGQFNQVRDAATDAAGTIYTADFKNQRVQVFSPTGTFLRKWGVSCPGTCPTPTPGQFKEPYGIQLDDADNVYVSDNRRIQKFTPAGSYLTEFGVTGTGDNQFFQLRRVAVGAGATPAVYGADLWGYKILQFTQAGALERTYGNIAPAPGGFNQPYGLSLNGDTLYVADTNNQRIETFSASTGALLDVWGERGFGKDNLNGENWPRGVAYNATTDTAWVADTKNYRVVERGVTDGTPTGRLFGSTGAVVDTSILNWVYGLATYQSDVIVADTFGNKVGRWTGNDPTTPVWTATGLSSPKAVTVSGNVVYVADSVNHRVVKLNAATGSQLGVLGAAFLHRIEGVAVAPNGNIWVADTSFNRLVEMDSTGKMLQSFGRLGTNSTSFNMPAQLVIGGTAAAPLLYVTDSNNDRVQVFDIS